MSAEIRMYRGIESARIRPLVAEPSRPFTSIALDADGVEVCWMLDAPLLPAFAQRLRDIADAIETGQSVTLDKGYRGADGAWVPMGSAVIVNGEGFAPGYTVKAAAHELATR